MAITRITEIWVVSYTIQHRKTEVSSCCILILWIILTCISIQAIYTACDQIQNNPKDKTFGDPVTAIIIWSGILAMLTCCCCSCCCGVVWKCIRNPVSNNLRKNNGVDENANSGYYQSAECWRGKFRMKIVNILYSKN